MDEASRQVAAVLLIGPEGAVELRPFAAPRNADIWDDIRKQIAAETARRGGTATEADGAYGKELRVLMPMTTPDGQAAQQPSRVMGIAGPAGCSGPPSSAVRPSSPTPTGTWSPRCATWSWCAATTRWRPASRCR